MSNKQELIELLEDDVIVEIESYIDALYEGIANSKQATPQDKEQLAELQELRSELNTLLEDAKDGDIDEDEAKDIIDELDKMREESE